MFDSLKPTGSALRGSIAATCGLAFLVSTIHSSSPLTSTQLDIIVTLYYPLLTSRLSNTAIRL